MNIPDHPEIARAQRIGYGSLFKVVRCTGCGAELTGDRRLYRYGGEILCGGCFRESLLGDTSTEDLADAFDVESTTAYELLN